MAGSYKCILLFGSPGVGKGTQGKILTYIPGFYHLATGDMFRSLDKQSDLGKEFMEYSSKGLLVPDELTIRLWKQYVQKKIDADEYNPQRDLLLLDGIPRSHNQAKEMAGLIDVLGVIHLVASDVDEMVQRMVRRAKTEGRHDDADENVIRRRFEVYKEETAPVLNEYDKTLIHEIDAMGTPAEVLLKVLQVLVPLRNEHFGNPLK